MSDFIDCRRYYRASGLGIDRGGNLDYGNQYFSPWTPIDGIDQATGRWIGAILVFGYRSNQPETTAGGKIVYA